MKKGGLERVFEYIDKNFERSVEELRELVRQPSNSATGEGVLKCAELVKQKLEEVGMRARLLPTNTFPVVFGELNCDRPAKTLLIYTHYDVQPPDPLDEWIGEPYGAEIHEGRMFGRGTSDSKGNLLAVLKAAEAFLKTTGTVPLNIRFICDGEEEIGSPNLPPLVDKNRDLLMSDAVFALDGGLDFSDRMELKFGQKGMLSFELRVKTAAVNIHSKYAGIVANSAWRLLWALGTLKSSQGQILVPGVYEKVEKPAPAEIECIEKYCGSTLPKEKLLEDWGIENFLGNIDEKQALRTILFQPTANLQGFHTGYGGEGTQGIIPCEAVAKMDWNLAPNQDPDEIFEKILKHLGSSGFGDVEVKKISSTKPEKVSFETSFALACCRAAKEVYGVEATVLPINPGYAKSGPWLANRLGITSGVHKGIAGPMPCNQHAPNEFIDIEYFRKGIKYCAAAMKYYAEHE